MNALPTMRDAVHDEKSFVEFLEALSMDWSAHLHDQQQEQGRSHPPTSSAPWQSTTIGDFLDGAVRTGDSELDSVKVFDRPANHWHRVACILYGGKRYE
jgi:hypothetical protein